MFKASQCFCFLMRKNEIRFSLIFSFHMFSLSDWSVWVYDDVHHLSCELSLLFVHYEFVCWFAFECNFVYLKKQRNDYLFGCFLNSLTMDIDASLNSDRKKSTWKNNRIFIEICFVLVRWFSNHHIDDWTVTLGTRRGKRKCRLH